MKTPAKPSAEFGREIIDWMVFFGESVEGAYDRKRPNVSAGVRQAELATWRESVEMANREGRSLQEMADECREGAARMREVTRKGGPF